MTILLALIAAGVLLYLLALIPMDGAILQLIRVVVILSAVLYVCRQFGMFTGIHLGF